MLGKFAAVCALVLAVASCTAAEEPGTDGGATEAATTAAVLEQDDEEIRGSFSMVAMAHTTSYLGTDVDEEQEPNPWDGTTGESDAPYRYAAIPCNEDAPVNNISGDLPTFNTLIPNSRVPASTRSHPLSFEVVGEGDDARLEGTLELTVCQLRPGVTPDPDPVSDADKDRIRFEWDAGFSEASDETIVWQGTFSIVGGTGPYADLEGEGEIGGYFFCFAPEGCTELGEYRDVQYSMVGTYVVPADALDAATTPQPTETDQGTGGETAEPTEPETEATDVETEPTAVETEAEATEDATEEETEEVTS